MAEQLHIQQQRQLDFLKSVVVKYVKHKQHIFKKSLGNEPLHKAQFLKAIDVLNKEMDFAKDYEIAGYANMVNRNMDYFKMLLPHPNNDSYVSSLNCLDMMQGLCFYYLKQNGNA